MTGRVKTNGSLGDLDPSAGTMSGTVLRLYVAGAAPHSARALSNIRAILSQRVDAGYSLDVVDVLREPARALKDGILVTPTLVKLSPPPVQTIVGDLSASDVVLRALGFTR